MIDFLAAGAAGGASGLMGFLPIIGIFIIFWFFLFRPQMKRQKEHAAKIAGLKKNDKVVTAGGLLGKVTKVDDDYCEVEIAPNVRVKAVKGTIGDIIEPGTKPAAND